MGGTRDDTEKENDLNIRFLPKALYDLRKRGTSDVIIICQDKEFYAHKLVLKARSPYFKTLFSKEYFWKETVVFKNIEPATMDAILDFVYICSLEKIKTLEEFQKVLDAASMLKLDQLVLHCCDAIGEMKETYWNQSITVSDSRKPSSVLFDRLQVKNGNLTDSSSEWSLSSDSSQELPNSPKSSLPIVGKKSRDLMPKSFRKFGKHQKGIMENWMILETKNGRIFLEFGCKIPVFFICVLIILSLSLWCWCHPYTPHKDFTQDLLNCLNSGDDNQFGCISSMLIHHSPAHPFTKRIVQLQGNGIISFVFKDDIRPIDPFQNAPPLFKWTLTYHSNYHRNTCAKRSLFFKGWRKNWGQVLTQIS